MGEKKNKESTDDSGRGLTESLRRAARGDAKAEERAFRLAKADLEKLAKRHLRREGRHHTLSTGDLVNEAYLRFAKAENLELNDRRHFFNLYSTLMRQVLVDHARRKNAKKRGGPLTVLPFLNDSDLEAPMSSSRRDTGFVEILALDGALRELAALKKRQVRVFELCYFGGLEQSEVAEILEVSTKTVKNDWRNAKMWIARKLFERGLL